MRAKFEQGGTGYGEFKKELFTRLWEFFGPMRQRRQEILKDRGYIDQILRKGAERANAIADRVMERVRQAVGLR
jgi:tryptophanyl-tRNA synthetase